MRLLTLPKDIISMLEEGHITAGQARPLIGISNASSIAEEIVSRKLSARNVEQLTRDQKVFNKKGKKVDSNILSVQKEIEDKLGLKVSVHNKKNNSGKISIEYNNLDQFQLVSKLLKQK